MLAINSSRTAQFDWRQFFYSQAKLYKSVAKFTGKLSGIKKIRYGKLERQEKHLLKQGRPFEVNQDRCIGNQNGHRSNRHLIQSLVEFAHRNVEKFGGARFSDHAFSERAVAKSLETPWLLDFRGQALRLLIRSGAPSPLGEYFE